jgi:hypothetical protein
LLRVGDVVPSINGKVTANESQDELGRQLRDASASGAQDLRVIGADGKEDEIQFKAQDIRWYVER